LLRSIVLVLALLPASVIGQQQIRSEEPKDVADFLVDVAGPETIAPGDLAVFDVGKSTAKRYAWTLIPSSKNFRVDTSLRLAYLSGASGTYTIVLVGTDADNVAIDTQTVTISGTPPPGPGPGPGPGPPPPDPSGPLAKQMASWLAPIKSSVTKQQIIDVGSVYEAIAAEAVATQGTLTKDGFVASTQTQVVRVLGPQTALAMRDPFFIPLAKYMNAKKLAVDDEAGHAALWREVGAALTEVSKSW